jgi:peptidoglycan/xylan/chitin deacetylase (PgdA/CDA1 family)
MSKLSSLEQEKEIYDSFNLLKSITDFKDFKTFCYPYGGFHNFTEKTDHLLNTYKCDFSFNVESRDIGKNDILNRKQALPRYDCNEFPFGNVMGNQKYITLV